MGPWYSNKVSIRIVSSEGFSDTKCNPFKGEVSEDREMHAKCVIGKFFLIQSITFSTACTEKS